MIGMKGCKELRTKRSSNSAMDEHRSKKFVAFQTFFGNATGFISLAAGYAAFFVRLVDCLILFFAARSRENATNSYILPKRQRQIKTS